MPSINKQDFSYAYDCDKNLVNIQDAIRGNKYFCPICNELMILKQGEKRKWHYAHKNNTANCSYESYLHTIAKIKIAEAFNNSKNFKIQFNQTVLCSIKDCPIGKKKKCNWKTPKEFDLKKYYDTCSIETHIDTFVADLLITDTSDSQNPPIFVEIWCSHKSTKEKMNSSYRIIEIRIDSEKDINDIISTLTIKESEGFLDKWEMKPNDKIRFYNFKSDENIPKKTDEQPVFYFWINSDKYQTFHCDTICAYRFGDYEYSCLSVEPKEIKNAIFYIKSTDPLDWDIAFEELLKSGLGLKYCTMCKFYKYNETIGKCLCIKCNTAGTPRFPYTSNAMNCPQFKQKDYTKKPDNTYTTKPEYKVYYNLIKLNKRKIVNILEINS